jgi:thioredoxin reductase
LPPHSARSDFTLKASKEAEKTPEFQSLKEATEEIPRQVEQRFKVQVIAATSIKTTVLKKQIAIDLATSLRLSTKAFLIAAGINEHSMDTAVITILEHYHTV